MELIHDAGGVAVVAHPYWDVKDPEQVRDLVQSLVRDVGLDGIAENATNTGISAIASSGVLT